LHISCFVIVVKIYVIYSLSWFFSVLTCWLWLADNDDVKKLFRI